MKRASVRDLRYSFKEVEAQLAEGEEIEIVKRNKVIAKLVPVPPEPRPEMPDFLGRMRIACVAQRDRIDLVDMPRDECGKGFLGIALNVFAQQGGVIQFVHLHLNAADWENPTAFFGKIAVVAQASLPVCFRYGTIRPS